MKKNEIVTDLKIILILISGLFYTCNLALAQETITITTYYPAPYGSYAELTTTNNTYLATEGGKVGIGTTTPGAKLEVSGQVKITGGLPGNNKVLTSDANGLASWQAPAGGLPVKGGWYGRCSSYQACVSSTLIFPGQCVGLSCTCAAGYTLHRIVFGQYVCIKN